MLGQQASADDVVLTTLFKAVDKFGMFELRGSFGAWLHRIVVNECIMVLRNQQKFESTLFDESTHSAGNSVNLHRLNPEDDLVTKELSELVGLNIRHIPKVLRDPLLLSLEGFSCLEIGERLGISKAAAKSRMFRARQMLRQKMLPHLPVRFADPGYQPRLER
jgi:RNA polymerase sigma-70 factor (ECF subfamily)